MSIRAKRHLKQKQDASSYRRSTPSICRGASVPSAAAQEPRNAEGLGSPWDVAPAGRQQSQGRRRTLRLAVTSCASGQVLWGGRGAEKIGSASPIEWFACGAFLG